MYQIILQIPLCKVATYGQIAATIGSPRAARQVGWALRVLSDLQIPWWRVINSKGYLSIKNSQVPKELQKELLEKEGVEVNNKFVVNLKKYQWRPVNC